MILAWLLLLTGLTISAVAIYYSVVGLTAIFAAAAIPIIVMGTTLEVAKLVCASWLKANWDRVPRLMKLYMTTAVVVLMIITSMGIFGFLSKAHTDQSLVSGDVQSKIAIYDEKIKTEKENIEANRKALKQMDEAVDQILGRSTTETGADKAVAIRRSQQKERARLQNEISQSQKLIAELNDARAPIAAEVRKVEAEVGPIKYIAKFIYGDDPDTNILEKAVTWVIVIIVVVFDPLAVIMLLAAQMTFGWNRKDTDYEMQEFMRELEQKRQVAKALDEQADIPGADTFGPGIIAQEVAEVVPEAVVTEEEMPPCYKCGTTLVNAPGIGPFCPNKNCDVLDGPFNPDQEPITFTYTPPATSSWPFPRNTAYEDKLWEESLANVATQNYPETVPEEKPKKERKPRKKKVKAEVNTGTEQQVTAQADVVIKAESATEQTQSTEITTTVKPARDIEKEQQQAAILEAIIESTSKSSIDERPGDYITPPADNVDKPRVGTVGAPLPGDELYGKTDNEVKYQSRKRNAGGWFPEKKK